MAAPALASAQVTINEVCASNIDLIDDEDGESSDWIELWNHGAEAVDLTGWHLSDDPDDPEAWTLPPVSLPAQQGLLLWASGRGMDRPVGPHYHTFVEQGSIATYIDGNTEPPATWRDVNFDDSSWRAGPSGFGFGDDDDATVVNANTVYVRHRFKVERKLARSLSALFLHVDYDDGYVAYLNGHEIARENMPSPPGTHVPAGTLASGAHEALLYQGIQLPYQQLTSFSSILRPGENVLSVQAHNGSHASDDLSISMFLTGSTESPTGEVPNPALLFKGTEDDHTLHTNFKLSAEGEVLVLSNATGSTVDHLRFPQLYANTSFGHSDIAGPDPLHFLEPTPGAQNTREGRPGYAPLVSASPEGQMSATSVSVTLSSTDPVAEIRYTLDCTEPDEQSTLYAGAIQASDQGATVVRSRSFMPGLWPSPISTDTYLVDAAPLGELPIFSLVTEPDNLWDPETGIYVLGPNAAGGPWFDGANFWNDWERPLHIEFFEEDGARELAMDVGTKIHGGFSRTLPQKSMRLMARGGYGDGDMDYAFFDDVENDEYQSLIIRNSGNDFYFGSCRDPITHTASRGTGIDDMAYRPTVVYLNGEYWGLMAIRERQDDEYLAYHHGVDPDKVDILQHNMSVIDGSAEHYQEMLDYLRSHDMSDDAHFDVIASMVDVDNYAHYFTHQIWANNTDWPQNNMKFWRPQEDGGKWRWLLYDTDFGLGLFGGPVTANSLTRLFDPNLGSYYARELFLELMENDGFK
ncbi:MAG: CotH kinase family protein, partial [Planctomycetes bacterium]|nr:CotH kinase family protein [Planctomycetota bacterium]